MTSPSKRSCALLSIDDRLMVQAAQQKLHNSRLLNYLETKGIRDIYLFTDKSLSQSSTVTTCIGLLAHLNRQGFNVYGVLTSADLAFSNVSEAQEPDFTSTVELGGAFKLAKSSFTALGDVACQAYSLQESLMNKISTAEDYGSVLSAQEKHLFLLKAFLTKAPNWVSEIVIFEGANTAKIETLPNEAVYLKLPIKLFRLNEWQAIYSANETELDDYNTTKTETIMEDITKCIEGLDADRVSYKLPPDLHIDALKQLQIKLKTRYSEPVTIQEIINEWLDDQRVFTQTTGETSKPLSIRDIIYTTRGAFTFWTSSTGKVVERLTKQYGSIKLGPEPVDILESPVSPINAVPG